jgi:hypothetical protein
MSFDHERLEVYQLALDFIVSAADVVQNSHAVVGILSTS